jgi:II/X family phage/plasmid replication protein
VIDWTKIRVPIQVTGKIPGDRICIISPDGELKWEKIRAVEVVGSFEGNVHVSACPVTGALVIDGNPAKFFQGHNVFGSDDIHGLVHALVMNVVRFLELEISPEVQQMLDCDYIELAHVDINEMYSVGTLLHARAAVRAIGELGTMRHRGRALLKEGTAYFGKHSRRSAVKVYAKGDELRDHKLPKNLPFADEIESFASDKLRIEVVLRGMELKSLGLDMLCNWKPDTGVTLHRDYIGRVNLPENVELPPAVLEGLPARLQLAYSAWLRGDDLRATLPRMTFYRYRKALLPHGVDLLALRTKDPQSNVFPLRRVIELRPAGVPEWAKGTSAYFEPPRRTG